MNAEQLEVRLERAAKAMDGVRCARVTVVLPDGGGDTVRVLAAAWGTEVHYTDLPDEPTHRIVAVDHCVGTAVASAQATEAVPAPECEHCGEPCEVDKRWCPECLALPKCSLCGDPVRETGSGIQPDGDICGDCVERADDARRAKARRAAEMESTRGDYLRDQRKDGVGR